VSAHPSVGRIVHYIPTYEPYRCLAAIVTGVPAEGQWRVDLMVFDQIAVSVSNISFEESGVVPRTWHWPERDEVM